MRNVKTKILAGILLIACVYGLMSYFSREKKALNTFAEDYNSARSSTYDLFPLPDSAIVFVGNSLTEGFPVEELHPGIYNRGIKGNRTDQVLARIKLIALSYPKKIFLEMGINDLINNISVDSVFRNYKMVIETIKMISPATSIIIQSATPTWTREINEQVNQLNALLKKYSEEKNLVYINLHDVVLKNHALDSTCTYDGFHFNGKGYAAWRKLIDTLIK